MEVWKDIDDYEGRYQVSSFARIRSLVTSDNQRRVTLRKTPLIRKLNINTDGYLRVSFSVDGVKTSPEIHRMVAKAFVPNPLNLPEVNHKDGNKLNSLPDNLEWTNRSGNVKHAYDNDLKTAPRGEDSGAAKLDNDQVKYIFNSSRPVKSLAAEFNVKIGAIYNIKQGNTWFHLTGKVPVKGRRLLPEQVIYIFNSTLPQKDLAKEFNISRSTVCNLKSKKIYYKITAQLLCL